MIDCTYILNLSNEYLTSMSDAVEAETCSNRQLSAAQGRHLIAPPHADRRCLIVSCEQRSAVCDHHTQLMVIHGDTMSVVEAQVPVY